MFSKKGNRNVIYWLNLLHFSLYFFCTVSFSQITEEEEELVAPSRSMSSNKNYSLEVNYNALFSTQQKLPFWMYHNRRGRLNEGSNYAFWTTGRHVIFFDSKSFLISGVGLLIEDSEKENLFLDELYLHFQNPLIYVTAGRKQKREEYSGLSSSNRSVLWSLNAKPLLGFQLGTSQTLFLFSKEGLGFEASWNEYLMGKDRYMVGTKLHHKNFKIVFRKKEWQIKAGLQHFAQWAGTSIRTGKQPDGISDYFKLITAKQGGSNATVGDQMLALGNHLGGWEVIVSREFTKFELQAFYQHLFEDGSGLMLRNTPDGRYGFFYSSKEKNNIINSFIYEFFYMKHHSHTFPSEHRYDNYFNHGEYRSGWTYKDFVLGAPFFTPHPTEEGVINNKFVAQHAGVGGNFDLSIHSFSYKLLLSYAHNSGTFRQRYNPSQDVFYLLSQINLRRDKLEINLQLGVDFDSFDSPIYGAGINLKYRL